MEGTYSTAIMQGVTVYLMLAAFIFLGGIAIWFGYRFFGAMLMVASVALLVWFAAGAPT